MHTFSCPSDHCEPRVQTNAAHVMEADPTPGMIDGPISERFRRDLVALVIRNAVPMPVRAELARRFSGLQTTMHSTIQGLQIAGTPRSFFEARRSPGDLARYYESAQEFDALMARFCTPHPRVDHVISALFQDGVKTLALEDARPMLPFLFRCTATEGLGIRPHYDHLGSEVPESVIACSLSNQCGLNIYLDMPPRGGELLIWPRRDAAQCVDSIVVDEGSLGDPETIIRPQAGDAIVFPTDRVHAVAGGFGGPRITFSGFAALTPSGRWVSWG